MAGLTSVDAAAAPVLLRGSGVVKRFGGLAAVDGVDLEVRAGETFGIAGPNGAGKTTLFDVVTGITRATDGVVEFDGKQIQDASVHRICHLGLARTFQLPSVFDTQTVLANVLAGAQFGAGRPWWSALRTERPMLARAEHELDFVGLAERAGLRAGPLPVYDKKRLMIASALATEPRMLFLDEPFGGLSPNEIDALLGLLRRVKERGVTIVLIEHVMRALMALSDRVLIMNQGRRLFEGTPQQVVRDQDVVRVYLGKQGDQDAGDPDAGEREGSDG